MDDARPTAAGDVWAQATSLPERRTTTDLVVRDGEHPSVVWSDVAFGTVAAVLALVERLSGTRAAQARQAGDVVLGVAWQGYRLSTRVVGLTAGVAGPAVRLVTAPPLVPPGLTLRGLADRAADSWRTQRPASLRSARDARDVVVPATVDVALAPLDLTQLVVDRVVLSRVVQAALDQLDLTRLVVDEVDLARVVDAALDRLDLTQLVLDRVTLGRVVDAALDQLDLTQLVLERVDLEPVVNRALDQLDLTQLVRDRVDLVGIAEEVIDAVDLPEIIRSSTGSVASETVRSIRMQSIDADEGVQRIVDRFMLRRKARSTEAPAGSDSVEAPEASGVSGESRPADGGPDRAPTGPAS